MKEKDIHVYNEIKSENRIASVTEYEPSKDNNT